VSSRILIPTDIRMQTTGTYNPSTRQGSITAVLFNSGLMPLDAVLHLAITEDSLYYAAPNGDVWHNHVLRDYVPTQVGTPVSIPSGGYDTVSLDYTIGATWVERKCAVITYVQGPQQADSSRPCYQGGSAPLLSFTGVEEPRVPETFYDNVTVSAGPNPCRASAQFSFTGKPGEGYHLSIFAPDGRLVREFSGAISSGRNTLAWDRTDENGLKVGRGVYGYRLVSTGASASGKLVLAD
jgi:hypothetical protein